MVLTAVVVSTPAVGADDPPGTDGYEQTARLTTVGKPLDLLVHPESGKLYVGSDTVAGTTGGSLAGVYVVDPAAGNVLNWVKTSPAAPARPPNFRANGSPGPCRATGCTTWSGCAGSPP